LVSAERNLFFICNELGGGGSSETSYLIMGGGGACLWTKRPGREAGHLLPSSAEI